MEALTYIKNLIKDPNIASIAPTSSFGIERLCRKMDFPSAKVLVEYGPATGVITQRLLQEMTPDAQIVTIDTNERFNGILKRRMNDSRLHVIHDSAENVDSIVKKILNKNAEGSVDYIISGIPFTMIPPEIGLNIVRKTYQCLRPGGKFLVYQFLKPETAKGKGIHRLLPQVFKMTHREIEFRNIPPLRIYEATRD